MNLKLLEQEVQDFIKQNTGNDITKLALQKNPFGNIEWAEILNQIAARTKAKDKLPTWYNTDSILYPSKVSVEQTSSEVAAHYKSSLISGKKLIDLTGGFGIDDYYFSQQVEQVTHTELNAELSAIAAHNFKTLATENITAITGDSIDILQRLDEKWDWIYADPARRSDTKGKVFMLKDCLPNVPELLDSYFNYTDNILIKTAPLLDISAGMGELHSVKEIHIVAIQNEVKELLWVLQKEFKGIPTVHSVNILKDSKSIFTSLLDDSNEAQISMPENYLYEPNSAVMKSGAFNQIGKSYNVGKLHRHTHLYTSENLVEFPGRVFKINKILPYQKSEMKEYVQGKKMNITVRNFPLSVPEIAKKWKVKDGGDTYAFFATNMHNAKIVLLCKKA